MSSGAARRGSEEKTQRSSNTWYLCPACVSANLITSKTDRFLVASWNQHGEGLDLHHGDVVRLFHGIEEEGLELLLSNAEVQNAMGKAITMQHTILAHAGASVVATAGTGILFMSCW